MEKATKNPTDNIKRGETNVYKFKLTDILPMARERGWNLIKLGAGRDRKGPVEKWQNFQTEARSPDELAGHTGNIGITCGKISGRLFVLDIDDEDTALELLKRARQHKPTMVVKTKHGRHYYYRLTEDIESFALNCYIPGEFEKQTPKQKKNGTAKMLLREQTLTGQYTGKYVVAPGSIHYNPDTGARDGEYTLMNDLEPALITPADVEALKEAFKARVEAHGLVLSATPENYEAGEEEAHKTLPYSRLINMDKFVQSGDELEGSNPWHGSEGGHNFSVNVKKGVWTCRRCVSGGGIVEFLAVREGVLSCEDCHTGALTGKKRIEVIKKAEKEFNVNILTKRPRKNILNEEWLEYKENKQGETIGITVKYGILAEHLVNEEHILTFRDTGESYIYSEGFYAYGQPIIREKIQKHVPIEYFKKGYKVETEDAIIGMTGVERLEISKNIDKNIINLKNGLLDLTTMELLPHTPLHFSFSQVDTPWVNDAECPIFEEFLNEALPEEEDRKTLQEFFGSILLQDMRYQKALVLFGEGGNGKSTVLNIVKKVIGVENVATETIQNLINNRFRLANIYGKLANLCPDNPSTKVADSGVFTAITGGDTVTGEMKGKNPFKFENYATMVLSANSLPKPEDATDAYFDRFIIVTFNQKFRGERGEVKNMADKIVGIERVGILNWMIAGLKRLLKNDRFTKNPSTEEIKREYIHKSDPISAFYMDMIEEDDEGYTTKEKMYSAYKKYCKDFKMHIVRDSVFAKEFHSQSGNVYAKRIMIGDGKSKRQTQVWAGVGLNAQPLQGYEIRPLQATEGIPSITGRKQTCFDMLAGLAGLAGVKVYPHVTRKKDENIIGKCYILKILKNKQEFYKKLQRKGFLPLQPLQGGNFHAKNSQPDLFFERDRNEATEQNIKTLKKLLADLNIIPGDHGRHDKADLLRICNNESLSTAEAITAIEELGGIETEQIGHDTVYDFSHSGVEEQ